jgi:undecaprenyl-diphosphatase
MHDPAPPIDASPIEDAHGVEAVGRDASLNERRAREGSAAPVTERDAAWRARIRPAALRSAVVEHDRRWARRLHRATVSTPVVLALHAVSRLGNGVLWYLVIALLPLVAGPVGLDCAVRMAFAGILNLALYKWLKPRARRRRPFETCPDIRRCAPALDDFSFPSGHTLHAVGFTTVLVAHFPAVGIVFWPIAALIAASRVILGMHYPTDVIVGAMLGWLVASAAMLVL